MPKKIATENINAKLGIVMKSGKAQLGKKKRDE
jgi:ribosomal protein L30E